MIHKTPSTVIILYYSHIPLIRFFFLLCFLKRKMKKKYISNKAYLYFIIFPFPFLSLPSQLLLLFFTDSRPIPFFCEIVTVWQLNFSTYYSPSISLFIIIFFSFSLVRIQIIHIAWCWERKKKITIFFKNASRDCIFKRNNNYKTKSITIIYTTTIKRCSLNLYHWQRLV